MTDSPILVTPQGLYCPEGDFYIDPWKPVPTALVTHAHGDHLYPGCGRYITGRGGAGLLRLRLGEDAKIDEMPLQEPFVVNGARVSLHSAGHVLGSCQVRVERRGRIAVATGDMKRQADPTCAPFDVQRCDDLYLDATFSLPIYRWPDASSVMADIHTWWRSNQAAGRTSILFAYALGKAQRVLAGLEGEPILAHGAVLRLLPAYRTEGINLPSVEPANDDNARRFKGRAFVLAPPSAQNTPWLRKFAPYETGFASGWMLIRGAKRRRNVDRGFVLSDHADWPDLLRTVRDTGASHVTVMHGAPGTLSRYLAEGGLQAVDLAGRAQGEPVLAPDELGA